MPLEGAASVVERARAGDQVAMAILVRVRQRSRESPKARRAFDTLTRYVKEHPAPPEGTTYALARIPRASSFGGEPTEATFGWFGSRIVRSVASAGRSVGGVSFRLSQKGLHSLDKVRQVVKKAVPAMKYIAAVAPLIPGVGTTVGAALSSASALADGQDITSAMIAAAAGAVPGGAVALDASGKVIPGGAEAAIKKGIAHVTHVKAEGKHVTSESVVKAGYKNAGDLAAIRRMSAKLDKAGKRALQLGYVLGVAEKLQAVARRGAPIATISTRAAWELGE